MTSSGTESILLAVKTPRDYMRMKKGIRKWVIPESAHSTYDKAAQYFNIKLRLLILLQGFHMVSLTPLKSSVIWHLRQTFAFMWTFALVVVLPFDRKLGYSIPPFAGSRAGGLIAGAWAAMMSLGLEGHLENTKKSWMIQKAYRKGIKEISEFVVNDIMSSRGWHLNALQRPSSIHICITLQHIAAVEHFLRELRGSVEIVEENPGSIDGGLAPIYSPAEKMPDRGMVKDLITWTVVIQTVWGTECTLLQEASACIQQSFLHYSFALFCTFLCNHLLLMLNEKRSVLSFLTRSLEPDLLLNVGHSLVNRCVH